MPPNPDFQQTPPKYLKAIAIIHLAMLIGQVLFAIVSLAMNKKIIINIRFTDDPLVIIVPVAAVCGFFTSNFLFKQKLGKISQAQTLESKLMDYQTALITRFALLEAPVMLAIIAFFMTGILFFLVIATIVIGYFIYIRPTKDKIADHLALSYQQQELLNN
ncbi:hypothetical protein A0256_11630 [Mucilaginibacter sp. PAMC 26640]|nr:hypothetical protein A0256_11630 [Mucilaginibacter sp. PAMC 26640]